MVYYKKEKPAWWKAGFVVISWIMSLPRWAFEEEEVIICITLDADGN